MAEFAGSIPPSDPNFFGYLSEFRSKVDFLKGLAKSNWVEGSLSVRFQEQRKMDTFYNIDSQLDEALDKMAKRIAGGREIAKDEYAKVSIFLYVADKVAEFQAAALKQNRNGLYALCGSVRDWAHGYLGDQFFSKPLKVLVKEYLLNESQFVACAELCGVELLTIQDAASSYEKKAAELISLHGQEA